MNCYRVTASVKETFIATKEITFDVEAEDEESAKKLARAQASDRANLDNDDADHDDTEVCVESVEFIKGDDPPEGSAIPRCEKTPDMFEGEKQCTP